MTEGFCVEGKSPALFAFFFQRESLSSSQTGIPGWRESALFGAEAVVFLLSASFFWRSEGRNRSMLSSR